MPEFLASIQRCYNPPVKSISLPGKKRGGGGGRGSAFISYQMTSMRNRCHDDKSADWSLIIARLPAVIREGLTRLAIEIRRRKRLLLQTINN